MSTRWPISTVKVQRFLLYKSIQELNDGQQERNAASLIATDLLVSRELAISSSFLGTLMKCYGNSCKGFDAIFRNLRNFIGFSIRICEYF